MTLKKWVLLSLILIFSFNNFAQVGINLPNFDKRKFHFGVSLATNTADFRYRFQPGVYNQDSIFNVSINKVPGFTFAMVSSFNLSPLIHFRFLPGFSILEREFNYGHFNDGELRSKQTRLESFFLDFPLILKLRTQRLNNLAAYAITGASYGLDLATQSEVKTSPGEEVMKMRRHDFSALFGGGFDFFMMYCKLSLEIKVNNGINNTLIQENTFFSAPITSLKSKIWTFSIIFEG